MALPATEAFGAAAANLPNPPWTQQRTTRRVNTDGSGHGLQDADDAAGDVLAFWNADTFGADQYSQIQINSLVVGGGGCSANASVRASGSGDAAWNAYDWYTNLVSGAGNTELAKVVSGTATVLRNYATTFVATDTVRLQVVGQVLTAFKNGISIGTQSDAALSSGAAGCGTFRNGATVTIDNWQGDTIASGAVVFSYSTRRAPAKAGPFDQRGMLLSPYQRYSYAPSTVSGNLVAMLASGLSAVSPSATGGFVRNAKASAVASPTESAAAGAIRDFRVRASSGLAARAAAGAIRDLRSSGSAGASERATPAALRGLLARGSAAVAASLSAGALRGMKGTGFAVVVGDGVFTNVHGLVQFLARGLTGVRGAASLGIQRALSGAGLSGTRGVWQIGVVRDVRARGTGGAREAAAAGLLRDLKARGVAGVIGSQSVVANGLPPGIGITYLVFDSTVTAVLFDATTGAVIDTLTTSVTLDSSIDTIAFDAMIDKQSFQ